MASTHFLTHTFAKVLGQAQTMPNMSCNLGYLFVAPPRANE